MYRITVEGRFSAAHRHAGEPAGRPLHGHDFLVRLEVAGDELAEDVLVDFHRLEVGLTAVLAELSHRDLSTHADFAGRDATPAALARWLHGRLRSEVPAERGVHLAAVEVSDRDGLGARYEEPGTAARPRP